MANHKTKKPIATVTLDAKVIGLRMRKARKALGWNLYDMSRVTGIQRMTLACYECGARAPRIRNAVRICLALRRKLDWLILGKRSRINKESRKSDSAGSGRKRSVPRGAKPGPAGF